jgi:hypothetical protein
MNILIRFCSYLSLIFLFGCTTKVPPLNTELIHDSPIIADHNSVDLQLIPSKYIKKAKKDFGISYGHTSHGSQIISGMNEIMRKDKEFSFGSSGSANILTIFDKEPKGDLGRPNRQEWERRTRAMLARGWGDVNIVMWSWCGQVSYASEEHIDLYLKLMSGLEKDYPNVVFIYMTGHLDGSGENGNLHRRNEQIREFCRDNNKVLFDFADIERYDPDGNDYLPYNADDTCEYYKDTIKGNWAVEWCKSNPGKCNSYPCAHSESLNCDLKASAFWWMMARIAGWNPEAE